MCGIAGFVDFKKRSSSEILAKMSCVLEHRGPDGEGILLKETPFAQVGLGHRRLSIIDLSTDANQPMSYEGLYLIFNGEIYNYNEIREDLIREGDHFRTHSDTEVILHGWKKYGEAAITRWRGMFSMAIFDETKNEIVFIRDRAGVKPFNYYYKDGVFLFGSELKSLIAHPAFKKKINPDAVASFLQYGYISFPHSIYEDTKKLPPGHLLRLNLATGEMNIKQYWSVYDSYNKPKLNIALPEAIEETEKILSESFKYRMVADVPVGVFLSGGYDSSCVTALLQKDSTEKIKTFTIGTTDQKLNEAPFAKQIAQHLGTDHTEYYCTSKEALEIIPRLPHLYDEPFADPSAIPTMLVSRIAREKVTVALSADAGDEVFAGYNRYDYVARFNGKLNRIPRPIRKMVAATMDRISSQNIPFARNTRNFHSRYDKVKNLLKNPTTSELLKNLTHVYNAEDIAKLFKHKVKELETKHTSTELRQEFYDPLSFMMAVDYETYMVDDILQKVDRATMSVSLEGREPFLDQKIIEFVARIPSEYKYYKGSKKYLLKEIVHKYIPKEIMDRPKMGFAIPVASWLQNELKPLVLDYLDEKSLDAHGLFNKEEVNNMVTGFYNGRTERYTKIWHILMFQMWYREWMQ